MKLLNALLLLSCTLSNLSLSSPVLLSVSAVDTGIVECEMDADGSCIDASDSSSSLQYEVPAATYGLRAQQAMAATRAATQATKAAPSPTPPPPTPVPVADPDPVPSIDPDAPADWSIYDRPEGWVPPLLDPTPPPNLRFELSDQEKFFSAQISALLDKQRAYDIEAAAVQISTTPVFYTPQELSEFNGVNSMKPIYLSIRKNIYDVTLGRKYYAPGEKYSYLSGKEVARAFASGCYETTGLTWDVRGLDEEGKETVKHWTKFYAGKYRLAGKLNVPKVQNSDPLPDDNCEEKERYGSM